MIRRLESFSELCEDLETKFQQNAKFGVTTLKDDQRKNDELHQTCVDFKPECAQLSEHVTKLEGRFNIKKNFAQLSKMFDNVLRLTENRRIFLSEFETKFRNPIVEIKNTLQSCDEDIRANKNYYAAEENLRRISQILERMFSDVENLEVLRERAKMHMDEVTDIRLSLLQYQNDIGSLNQSLITKKETLSPYQLHDDRLNGLEVLINESNDNIADISSGKLNKDDAERILENIKNIQELLQSRLSELKTLQETYDGLSKEFPNADFSQSIQTVSKIDMSDVTEKSNSNFLDNYEKISVLLSDLLTEAEKIVDIQTCDPKENLQSKLEILLNLETEIFPSLDNDLNQYSKFGIDNEERLGGKEELKRHEDIFQKLSERLQSLKSKVVKLKPHKPGRGNRRRHKKKYRQHRARKEAASRSCAALENLFGNQCSSENEAAGSSSFN